MADKRLSKRSQRRLRQMVAQRLAGQPPKKPRLQECSELSVSNCDDGTQEQSSLSDTQEPASPPPSPTPTGSLPLPPPGLSSEVAPEYSADEVDQSDLEDGSVRKRQTLLGLRSWK